MTPKSLEFRRPLGLVLSGGGAMGAWQAGVLSDWVESGLVFDRVWGVSIGALNGAAYCVGRMDFEVEAWNTMDRHPLLELAPRQWPAALFSHGPIRRRLACLSDDAELRARASSSLYIMSYDTGSAAAAISSFEPGGRWDAPMLDHILASCAVPRVFPAVRVRVDGRDSTLVDGGMAADGPLNLEPLRGCKDILVLSLVQPQELRSPAGGLGGFVNRHVKRSIHYQMMRACRALASWPEAPRVLCFHPSAPLDQFFLDFGGAKCRAVFGAGRADAARFLEAPLRWLKSGEAAEGAEAGSSVPVPRGPSRETPARPSAPAPAWAPAPVSE